MIVSADHGALTDDAAILPSVAPYAG